MKRGLQMNDSMTDGGTESAIESALATLQPLKDLSRNWDVDIASCLEEYLHDLVGLATAEGINPVLDATTTNVGGQEKTNFAQAALILQNSSHVYSRKVEYLYTLVYKALDDFFREGGKESAATTSRRRALDPDIDEFQSFDPHMEFLLLDDVLPHDNNTSKINLIEDEEEKKDDTYQMTPNQSMTRTRLSLGSVAGVDRTYFTQRGSALGSAVTSSQCRALLGSLHQGTLRLVSGQCDIGDNGVLLMPGSAPSNATGVELSSLANSQRGRMSSLGGGTMRLGTPKGQFQIESDADDMPPPLDFGGDNDYGDDDDHDNDGVGFTLADSEANGGHDMAIPSHLLDEGVSGQRQLQSAESDQKKVTFHEQEELTRRIKPDPWALLDPHDATGGIYRPLKTGRTYRLPEGIEKSPAQCVTGARTRRLAQPRRKPVVAESKVPTSLIVQFFRALNKPEEDADFLEVKLDGLVYGGEFAYIAKASAKKKAADRREQKKLLLQQGGGENNARADLQHAVLNGYDEHDDDDGDDEYAGNFGYAGDYDDGDDHQDGDDDNAGNIGVGSLDDVYKNAAEEETNLGPKTFGQLCREHIEAFSKGADDFALNTKLSERVNRWQEKLAPLLEEEEHRAAFDIREYSSRVIQNVQKEMHHAKRKSDGSIQSSSTKVDFESVTHHLTKRDVCRTFLASLSLANSQNIRIDGVAGGSFQFELLSSDLNQPMETYLAPSQIDEGE